MSATAIDNGERGTELLGGILERMGIEATIELKEEDDRLVLDVQCASEDDVQLVIGRRGQVVDALQHLVSKMLVKHRPEGAERGKPVVVDAGGYRAKHVERLGGLAMRMADKAKESGKPVDLSPMSAFDRRIVHMALAEIEGVKTESEGEGDLRHIVVIPA